MRALALAFLPLLACVPADEPLVTPDPIAAIAGPNRLITSGDRAFVTTFDGLFAGIDEGSPARIAPASDVAALDPDGVTIDFVDPTGIAAIDTRSLAIRSLVGEASGVVAMAVTRRDLYWIEGTELRALDLGTGAARVVAASLPIDDVYQSDGIALVADETAAYVRTNRNLARYDRATGGLTVLASELGVASGLAIEGGDLYLADGDIATRISIADGSRHALGHLGGRVEAIVIEDGVAIIATSESPTGISESDNADARHSWLFATDDSGVERILAYRPASRIVSLALLPGSILFAERDATFGSGAILSIPR